MPWSNISLSDEMLELADLCRIEGIREVRIRLSREKASLGSFDLREYVVFGVRRKRGGG